MKRYYSFFVAVGIAAMLLAGCATQRQATGSAIGGTYGGIAGAILDAKNPWRGGVLGAALGALAGATIADISEQGARQAASSGRPVEYRTEDHRAQYYAEPEGYDTARNCRKVKEKVYVEGRLVKRRTVLYCDQPAPPPPPRYRYERRYDRYENDDD
ncbi:glycine zipper 2TM domain-containing protein [Geobacter pelophilus]|uniref:Glycine zipper 2TM domain-containing protein n=1 Tax=Geoanaerobacter pelophilus TaxID=60036 RepID=A0AAW4L2U8_9BACT|nr:glycine zipper 2TM domain-containing protein [Geoanaerobacter pelophilus]MBT0665054.1 glycine zipper 2TM domain-containing protein [Geoanaerobacter pelophilus]